MRKHFGRLLLMLSYSISYQVQTEIETQGGNNLKKTYVPLNGLMVPTFLETLKTRVFNALLEAFLNDDWGGDENGITPKTLQEIGEMEYIGIKEGESITYTMFVSMIQSWIGLNHYINLGIIGAILVGEEEFAEFQEGQEVANNVIKLTGPLVQAHLDEIGDNWLIQCSEARKNKK